MHFDSSIICCSDEDSVSNPLHCSALSNDLDGGAAFYADFLRRVQVIDPRSTKLQICNVKVMKRKCMLEPLQIAIEFIEL